MLSRGTKRSSGCSKRATWTRPQRQEAGSGPSVACNSATASRSARVARAAQSPPHQGEAPLPSGERTRRRNSDRPAPGGAPPSARARRRAARIQALKSRGSGRSAAMFPSQASSRSWAVPAAPSGRGALRRMASGAATSSRASSETVSRCMAAKPGASWRGRAASISPMRRKRQSPNQSWPRNTGWPGGETRLLALARAPPGGLAACGIASKGTQPVQSWAPSAPGTGSVPFPARRMGVRPESATAMPPALSAIMTFSGGLVMRATAARPSATVRARLRARKPAAAVSSGARLAMATARTRPPPAPVASGSRSEITGPWRVSRTRKRTGSASPRTRTVSSRTVKGRGPSGVS